MSKNRRSGASGLTDRAPFGKTPPPPTEDDARHATRVIAANARDAEDCAELLAMLDLDPRKTRGRVSD